MIKMIGLDLDGTVLNNRKRITDRTRNAIVQALKQGVIVLPATGRPLGGIPEEFMKIKGIHYALSANGAVIYDLWENKKIHEDCMDYTTILEILYALREIDIMADVFIDGIGYVEEESLSENLRYAPSPEVREYILKTRIPVANLPDYLKEKKQNIQKMTVNFRTLADGSLYMKDKAAKILSSYKDLAVVSGIPTNLEVTKKTATKGNGLLLLGKLLGIEKEEIMACGDSGNDREMLKEVGFGVAMENATPDVLLVADYVTKSNEEDGVARVIEEFVLKDTKRDLKVIRLER